KWETLLKAIEEGKSRAFGYYLPLREAVILFCAKSGRDREQIVNDMVARARQMGGSKGARIAKDNEKAFRVFESQFFPKIRQYRKESEMAVKPPSEETLFKCSPTVRPADSGNGIRRVGIEARRRTL